MTHRFARLFMAVLCASTLTTTAQADPLTITEGEFNFGTETPGQLNYAFAGNAARTTRQMETRRQRRENPRER